MITVKRICSVRYAQMQTQTDIMLKMTAARQQTVMMQIPVFTRVQ